MVNTSSIERFFLTVIQEELYTNRDDLQFYLNYLFEDIDFTGKNVLDIGGGTGLYSIYAACKGAREVICLEPESEGSNRNVTEKFEHLNSIILLPENQVKLEKSILQTYEYSGDGFDIVLLRYSINHLDEDACISLLSNRQSRDAYIEIFSKVYDLSKKGARLIICDCSRHNLFAHLRIKNPFAPSIEWHKHQSPETWASLLKEVGFANPRISWTTPPSMRQLGKHLLGNKYASYFLVSFFHLTMEKP